MGERKSRTQAPSPPRGRRAWLTAALALGILLHGGDAALAARGGPDCFGYTWADQCSDCQLDIPEFGPGAQVSTAVTDVVGPFDLQFVHRWYGRPITEVWVAPSGYVTFSDQGPNEGLRQSFPDPAPPNDLFAVVWLEVVDADITVESTPEFLHVMWTMRWVLDPTRPWRVHLFLLPDGTIRTHWPMTWGSLYVTVGYEDQDGECGRLLFEGDPETFETYEDEGTFPGPGFNSAACIQPPRLLDCQSATALSCDGVSSWSLPGSDPTPTSAHRCDFGDWGATERVFELRVDELADVHVLLRPSAGQQMGLFHPEACDEWTCLEGGLSSLTVPGLTPGDHALVVVDGAQPGIDEGDFTMEVTCLPLAQSLPCGGTSSGTTLGGPSRLDSHACLPGDSSGSEAYFQVDVVRPETLRLTLDSASGQSVFVFDAALPLDPALCLSGGSSTAWLPDPTPGRYIVVVDGPAGSEGPFDLELDCSPRLVCDAGDAPIGCNESLVGSTVGAASIVDSYGCRNSSYPGPERVHAFENPIRQVVTFRLDDSAQPGLDLLLLDACNEQACLGAADWELSIELEPGTYQVIVDGDAVGADYGLSTLCGQGITPEFISVSADVGECFTEQKTVWMTPEVPALDILFSIDLTGSMIPERAELPANVIDIIERLPTMLPDVAFGLVSHRDYYYSCLGWAETPCRYIPSDFGQPGDWPYRLHHPITQDLDRVLAAAESLPPADFGGTSGESYNRVMHEAVHDPKIGWRPGARRMLVTFGDDLPHDCDLASCFGGPPLQRGIDLGRDGIPDTGDELPTLDVIQDLIDTETILLHLDTSGGQTLVGIPYQQFWDCWARRTGGLAEELNDDGTVPAGVDLPILIAGLVQRRQACPELELVASPGFEEWLVAAAPVYFDLELPAVAEFEIEVCVPAGTPSGTYEFEVQALCGGDAVAAQQVVVRVGLDCAPVVEAPPEDQVICPGESVQLDASGVFLENCPGTVDYEWHDGPLTISTEPTVLVGPAETTTYDVAVSCSSDPTCGTSDSATVTVLADLPDGVYLTLRAGHEDDEATYHWLGARPLLPGEHFHLLKASDDPTNEFLRVNGEADLTRSFTETDVTSPLQFFDLRVATACEIQSEDEYPATHPP